MRNIANTEILADRNILIVKLSLIAEITKVRITFLVALTTALGYILSAQKISYDLFFVVIGIFLIACSASALNQYQESETDKLMSRTRNRPIPSGRATANYVFNTAMIFLITGSAVLFFLVNFSSLVIALFTMLWYNAVYTPLKKKSALAIIPGSLVGALPPLAGWVAAGGKVSDFSIYLIALYFFVWQIPHFWLLLSLYSKEYKEAGFPVLNDLMPDKVFKIITFSLLIVTVLMTMAVTVSGIVFYSISTVLIFLTCLFLLANSVFFLFSSQERKNIVRMFINVNIHTLLVIILLSTDKLISLNKIF